MYRYYVSFNVNDVSRGFGNSDVTTPNMISSREDVENLTAYLSRKAGHPVTILAFSFYAEPEKPAAAPSPLTLASSRPRPPHRRQP